MPSSAEGQSLGEIAASFGISEEALAIWQTRDIEAILRMTFVLRTPSPPLKGRKE